MTLRYGCSTIKDHCYYSYAIRNNMLKGTLGSRITHPYDILCLYFFRLAAVARYEFPFATHQVAVFKHTSLTKILKRNHEHQCFQTAIPERTPAQTSENDFERMVKLHQYPIQVLYFNFNHFKYLCYLRLTLRFTYISHFLPPGVAYTTGLSQNPFT